MIYDSTSNLHRYAGLAPEVWAKIGKYLESISGTTPETGCTKLDGDDLKIVISHSATTPVDQGKSELHRRYLDIHIPLCGSERFICLPDDKGLTAATDYDEAADCILYEQTPGVDILLEPGYFVLVYPGEPHQPQIGDGTKELKMVVKIASKLMD